MIRVQQDPRRNGTCELCGGHGREQLAECQVRKYCRTGERTETAE